MQKYASVVQDKTGRAIKGASVLVKKSDNSSATIYSDNGGTVIPGATMTTDGFGGFAFYAADGRYNLYVTVSGNPVGQLLDVLLEDPADGSAALAATSGASKVGFIQSGTGAVARTVQDELRETVKVRQFITTAVDGVTSNQAGIVAAVAEAFTRGADLEWPPGTYVSDANIPNFHSVRHVGPGVLKRGANTWKISGNTGTNTLYIATTGSSVNDGLSSTMPMASLQGAGDALQSNWPDALLRNGTFAIQLAAGTYNAGTSLVGLISKNRLLIKGPNVGIHPAVPTAIIEGTGVNLSAGMYLQSRVYAQLQDIKFTNWTFGSTAYGFTTDGACDVVLVNVHATNCGYAGLNIGDLCQARILGGIVENCPTYGVRCYSQASVSLGYSNQSAGSTPTTVGSSTIIRNCGTAAYAANSCRMHVDYCDINNNSTGILIEKNSRGVANYTNIASNEIGVQWQLQSAYGESGATNVFSGNTKNYVCFDGQDEVSRTNVFWDRTAQRTLYGASAYGTVNAKFEWRLGAANSGASYNSNVKAIFDADGTTNYIGLSGPLTSSTGFLWASVGKSAQATFVYNFTDDSLRFGVNGLTTGYRMTSAKFGADQATKNLGDATVPWQFLFANNVILNPPASVTPASNGQMMFELTSDTQLKIKVKGSDGTVRSTTLTLA